MISNARTRSSTTASAGRVLGVDVWRETTPGVAACGGVLRVFSNLRNNNFCRGRGGFDVPIGELEF